MLRHLALIVLLVGPIACTEPRPPDVVLIVIDTLRADALGCYGAVPGPTPRLDGLAASGVRFETAVATSSWTGATVSSLTTGRYPDELGLVSKQTPLPANVPTLSETLGAAGYQTLAVVSNGIAGPQFGHDRGYDRFEYEPYKSSGREGRPSFTADRVTDRALALWAGRDPDRATLLHVHYTDPHDPYLPPAAWRERALDGAAPLGDRYVLEQRFRLAGPPTPQELGALRAHYAAEVAFVDHELGRLLDGLDPGALVVVVADHGEEFLEHDGFLHGSTLFEEQVRVPLLVAGPGVPAGVVVEAPVSQVDVFPTVLELAGLPLPGHVRPSGTSLVPAMRGRADPGEPVVSILGGDKDWISVRRGPWKLHVRDGGAVSVLHDLRVDPGETRSAAEDHPEALDALRTWWERRSPDGVGQSAESVGDAQARLDALEAMGYLR